MTNDFADKPPFGRIAMGESLAAPRGVSDASRRCKYVFSAGIGTSPIVLVVVLVLVLDLRTLLAIGGFPASQEVENEDDDEDEDDWGLPCTALNTYRCEQRPSRFLMGRGFFSGI